MPHRTAAEEARLVARLIENASDVITVIDAEGTISFQSPSVERILGYDPNELDGTSVFDLVHPDDIPGARKRMSQVTAEPGPTRRSLIRMRHKNGSWRILEAVGTAMFDDPLVGGIVVNARDVTERLALEQELLQAQKLQAVGRLAAGIAHDFNNLFTVVAGHSALLLEELELDDPRRADVEVIAEAAGRAAQLTRRLLAFNRSEDGEPRILDVNAAVSELAATVRPLVAEKIALRLDLGRETIHVRCDPVELEQIVLNLVLNARDAIDGHGHITIATGRADLAPSRDHVIEARAGTYACISVADTGGGMDTTTRSHLFEPFFTTKAVGRGTGLGLASVHRIVAENGGTITFESDPPHGSIFSVYLPLARTKVAPAPRQRDFVAHGIETVLLVEDDDLVRDLARRLLEHAGYRVLTARAAPEALDHVRGADERIDLLLTDVVMPGMRGPELARESTRVRPELATLFMSGFSEDALGADEAGPRGSQHLTKPFSPQALVDAVGQALADREHAHQS
jgi:PAS domain S-box-containing protein